MNWQPYSHLDHSKRCSEAAKLKNGGHLLLGALVQAKLKGVVYCGHVQLAIHFADGSEGWRLLAIEPVQGKIVAPARLVTACGGIGCMCTRLEPARPQRSEDAPAQASDAQRSSAHEMGENSCLDFGLSGVRAAGCFCQAGVVAPPDSLNFEKSAV